MNKTQQWGLRPITVSSTPEQSSSPIPIRDDASRAGATGKPAQGDGGKQAQRRSRARPRHVNIPQSNDQADTDE
jgi:hypothetical protein